MANKVLNISALGRPFKLGSLYDARSDKIIPGVSLWDPATLEKDINIVDNTTVRSKIDAGNTLSEKCMTLGIDANLKMSFAFGLIQVEGSAHYLSDEKKSALDERVALDYSCTTEQRSLTEIQLGNIQHQEALDSDIATHVVAGVQYGAKAIMAFDKELSRDENRTEVSGTLEADIRKYVDIHGKAEVHIEDRDKEFTSSVKCTMYSEGFNILNPPTTFHDAMNTYRKLPDNRTPVPVMVTLLSLDVLDDNSEKTVRELSTTFIARAVNIVQESQLLIAKSNDLLNIEPVMTFSPRLRQQLRLFKTLIQRHVGNFTGDFMSLIPQARGGKIDEKALVEDLEKWEKSEFHNGKLNAWLENISLEVDIYHSVLQELPRNVQILKNEPLLLPYMFKKDILVCLALKITEDSESYLSEFEAHTNRDAPADRPKDEAKPWYDIPSFRRSLAVKLNFLRDYAKQVEGSKEVQCFALEKLLPKLNFLRDYGKQVEGSKEVQCFALEKLLMKEEPIIEPPGAYIMIYKNTELVTGNYDINARPIIELKPSNSDVPEFTSFSITCDIKDAPLADVSWFKDNKPIENTELYSIKATLTESVLTITSALNDYDEGIYRVEVSSGEHKVQEQVKITVKIDNEDPSTFIAACKGGHVTALERLTKTKNIISKVEKTNGLMGAVLEGQESVVMWLITSYGLSVNAEDQDGKTALYYACLKHNLAMAQELVDRLGADIEQGKVKPLTVAASNGYVDIVNWLLEIGADVNAKGANDMTALGIVELKLKRSPDGKLKEVKIILIAHGGIA